MFPKHLSAPWDALSSVWLDSGAEVKPGVAQALQLLQHQAEAARWLCSAPEARLWGIRRSVLSAALACLPLQDVELDLESPLDIEVSAAPGALEVVLWEILAPLAGSKAWVSAVQAEMGVLVWVRADIAMSSEESAYAKRLVVAHFGNLRCRTDGGHRMIGTFWPQHLDSQSDNWPVDRVALGLEVRRQRENLGLTRRHLAGLADVADSTIRNVETGRHNPTQRSRRRLLKTLRSLLLGRPESDRERPGCTRGDAHATEHVEGRCGR